MHPALFNLSPVTVHAYGVLYALGILSAVTLAEHLYRRASGNAGTMVEAAFPTVIGIILGSRAFFPGQVFVTYTILYGTFRFFIEFYRGDPRGEIKLLGMTLSTSQWISLIIIPIALIIYLYLPRKWKPIMGQERYCFKTGL